MLQLSQPTHRFSSHRSYVYDITVSSCKLSRPSRHDGSSREIEGNPIWIAGGSLSFPLPKKKGTYNTVVEISRIMITNFTIRNKNFNGYNVNVERKSRYEN